eukprot:TRINITY_DN25163_c0_g1_i1.p1 TRINITY_DN25163_c0_g1~~TRINITY_DN25163_c0_g1_i1.p1  ORF type:complete len:545 (+),score=56.60 TRINITY_DN25163_c0_g1_i1:151-1635(+)
MLVSLVAAPIVAALASEGEALGFSRLPPSTARRRILVYADRLFLAPMGQACPRTDCVEGGWIGFAAGEWCAPHKFELAPRADHVESEFYRASGIAPGDAYDDMCLRCSALSLEIEASKQNIAALEWQLWSLSGQMWSENMVGCTAADAQIAEISQRILDLTSELAEMPARDVQPVDSSSNRPSDNVTEGMVCAAQVAGMSRRIAEMSMELAEVRDREVQPNTDSSEILQDLLSMTHEWKRAMMDEACSRTVVTDLINGAGIENMNTAQRSLDLHSDTVMKRVEAVVEKLVGNLKIARPEVVPLPGHGEAFELDALVVVNASSPDWPELNRFDSQSGMADETCWRALVLELIAGARTDTLKLVQSMLEQHSVLKRLLSSSWGIGERPILKLKSVLHWILDMLVWLMWYPTHAVGPTLDGSLLRNLRPLALIAHRCVTPLFFRNAPFCGEDCMRNSGCLQAVAPRQAVEPWPPCVMQLVELHSLRTEGMNGKRGFV